MAIDTGHGASISWSGLALDVRSIDLGSSSRGSIDASHLGQATSTMRYLPEDLGDSPEVEVTCLFDPELTGFGTTSSYIDVISDDPAECTITFPVSGVTTNTAGFLTGSAFCTDVSFPTLETNELQEISFTIKFDNNETAFSYTAETA